MGKVTSIFVAGAVVLCGVSCIRRAPTALLDPQVLRTSTLTHTVTRTFTPLPTNTFTPVFTLTFTPIPPTPTHTPTPVPGATDTFTSTPVPPTFTFTQTPIPPTATPSPTTPALLPYVIRGESPFSMVINASWTTAAYPGAEITRGAPPYTSWTCATSGDAMMWGGHNGVTGAGASWCVPTAQTFTTFNVDQVTSDMYAGTGSLKFSGQNGGYSWGGWTYWGLTSNGPSWCTFNLDPYLTGITYWAKDLRPGGNAVDAFTIGPTGTDICFTTSQAGTDCGWTAPAVGFTTSWTQYWATFLSMDSDYPDNMPITNYTATGPTSAQGIEGVGAGRQSCPYAFLLDEVRFY